MRQWSLNNGSRQQHEHYQNMLEMQIFKPHSFDRIRNLWVASSSFNKLSREILILQACLRTTVISDYPEQTSLTTLLSRESLKRMTESVTWRGSSIAHQRAEKWCWAGGQRVANTTGRVQGSWYSSVVDRCWWPETQVWSLGLEDPIYCGAQEPQLLEPVPRAQSHTEPQSKNFWESAIKFGAGAQQEKPLIK